MTAVIFALFVATPSFAEPTELDKKTVASKAYVDTKQDIIPAGLVEFDDLGTTATVPALVVTNATGTALNGNTIGFLDLNTFNNLNSGLDELPDTLVPSIGLINAEVQNIWNHMPSSWTALTWDSAETTSTNAYETKFVGDTGATANAWPRDDKFKLVNTAALAQGLALKQNKITTGNIMFYDDPDGTEGDLYVPGLVAYDPQTSALSGNKIGILDQETIADDEGSLGSYSDGNGNYENGEMDNYVPTVRAVAEALQNIWSSMPSQWTALTWDSAETTSTNAYETKFVGDTGATAYAWPSADKTKLINTAALANALALKQNILPAKWTSTTSSLQTGAKGGQTIELNTLGNIKRRYITAGGNEAFTLKSGADNVILYVNGTKTVEEFQTSNFGGTGVGATAGQNYIKGALVSLELLKDVYSALHNEIQNATPTGTPSNVAMYDASTGALGDGVATYSGATAQNPYNATNDAAKIATAAAVETKQTKRVCAGYEPGHENDPDYCWLWDFPD